MAAEENRIPLKVNCGQQWSSTQVSSPGPDTEGCPDYVRMNQTVDNCRSPMGGLTDCLYAYGSSQCHFTEPAQWQCNNVSFGPQLTPVPPYRSFQSQPRQLFQSQQPFQPQLFQPCRQNLLQDSNSVSNIHHPNSNSLQTVYASSDTSHPFTFKFMTSRISKCQGCKGSLKTAEGTLPQPPDDLIVSRMECRPFVAPDGTVKVPSKLSAVHYHFKMECLSAASLSFQNGMLVCCISVISSKYYGFTLRCQAQFDPSTYQCSFQIWYFCLRPGFVFNYVLPL